VDQHEAAAAEIAGKGVDDGEGEADGDSEADGDVDDDGDTDNDADADTLLDGDTLADGLTDGDTDALVDGEDGVGGAVKRAEQRHPRERYQDVLEPRRTPRRGDAAHVRCRR
jgi:hypothetical protein